MKRHLLSCLFALFLSPLAQEAKAQSCTASATDILFGAVNLVTGAAYSSSGTITVRCSGTVGKKIRVCVNLGGGSGGTNNGSTRYLLNGATTLNYNLYMNAGMATVYGSFVWPYTNSAPGVNFVNTVPSTGNYTLISPVYGKIFPNQTNAATGGYLSSFSTGHANIMYDYNDTLPCSSPPALTASFTFQVSATAQPACIVTATDLDFGAQGSLSSSIDATSTLSTRCSLNTPYSIALDGGLSGATSGAARRMSLTGSTQSILYNLFKDAARTQAWGTTAASNTLAGTGTGLTQNVTVYGRIPAQTTPDPGNYSDMITVTITY